jgi:RNA polymerase sigma-70 factor (ECF subfamily)
MRKVVNNISDSELVVSYIKGEEKSLEILLSRHKSRVMTSIYMVVRDRYLAEDIFQETFIKVIHTLKSDKYNEEGKFLPWVLRIAHNLCIDYIRKAKRTPTIVLEDGSNVFNSMSFSESSAESIQLFQETTALVRNVIDLLPSDQKEVLMMRHYQDLSFQEIADKTGVSINTALGRMRYALINLRKMLDKNKIAYDQYFYPE